MLASGYVLDPITRKAATKVITIDVYLGTLLVVLDFPRRTPPITANQKTPSQYTEWLRKPLGAMAIPTMVLAKKATGIRPAHLRLFIGKEADV